MCQPALYVRPPSTRTLPARALSTSIFSSASFSSDSVRMMPDQLLHRLLQLGLDGVGILAAGPLERLQRLAHDRLHEAGVDRELAAEVLGVERGVQTGAPAEHEEVGERVAAQPVAAVHAAGHLAGREEAGHRARGGVGVDPDAAHHVVLGRPHLHRLLGDVDAGQLLELVVHGRQPLTDVVGRAAGADVEEDAAVRRSRAPP